MNLDRQAQAVTARDRALNALNNWQLAEAFEHVTLALRLDPGSIDGRILEARVHLALQQPWPALKALEAAELYGVGAEHQQALTSLRLEALIAAGRDEAALPVAHRLVELCPGDARAFRMAAGVSERLGRAPEQIEHLRQVVALSPGDRGAARTLARLIAAERPQSAAELMAGASAEGALADQWQATRWHVDAERYGDAEAGYRALLASAPDDAALWIEAGDLAARCGAHHLATQRYRRAMAMPGRHRSSAMKAAARAAMQAGCFRDAAWWWWKATRINQADAEPWAALVVCGMQVNRPCLTERAAARLATMASESEQTRCLAEAWLHAVSGLVIGGATQPAASPDEPASPLTWMLERSADVLAQQSANRPGWADTLYHTAVCRAALGDFIEARDCVQSALDINPHYKAATTLAARLPKAA